MKIIILGPDKPDDYIKGTKVVGRSKEWAEAIALAKEHSATLVIPKVIGLSDKLDFLRVLRDSGVPFVALDNVTFVPKSIVPIISVLEQASRNRSQIIRAGLADRMKEGLPVGYQHKHLKKAKRGFKKGTKVSAERRSQRAKDSYDNLVPEIEELQGQGKSLQQIADTFNDRGFVTTASTPFKFGTISAILRRANGLKTKTRAPLAESTKKKIVQLREQGMDTGEIATWLNERGIAKTTGGQWDNNSVWLTYRRLKGLPRKLQ